MLKTVTVGQNVTYYDEYGIPRDALITNIFGEARIAVVDGEEKEVYPTINLVCVNPDENQKDTYGRQIHRKTSICHRGWLGALANGNNWDFKV
jgi:hypothetical protein